MRRKKTSKKNTPEIARDLSVKAECYKVLAETARDVFFIINKDSTVQYVNNSGGEFLGLSPEAIIGKSLKDFFPKEVAEMLWSKLSAIFERGDAYETEDMVPSAQGPVWLSTMLVPLKDSFKKINAVMGISRDITARKKKEEDLKRLHENEIRYRTLSEALDTAVLLMRGNECVECNPATLKLFGLESKDEIIGKTPLDFAPLRQPDGRDSAEMVRWNIEMALKKNLHFFEWQAFRKNGEPVFMEVRFTPYHIGDEQFFQCIAIDITKRKAAETALRESESQLRSLSENLAEGMVYQINTGVNGRERKFTYLSPAVERLHGLKLEDALQNPQLVYNQIIDMDRKLMSEQEAHAIANRSKFEFDVRVLLPSGELRWRRFTSSPRACPDGCLLWDGIEIDITERRKAEDALKKSEAMLKEAQQTAHIGNWEWWPQSGKLFRSDENYRIFDLPDETHPSLETFYAAVHPDDVQRVRTAVQDALVGTKPYNEDMRIVRRDGEVRFVNARAEVERDVSGKAVRMYGTVQDITDRKRTEEALLASERNSKIHARELEESYNALKVLLKQREKDKRELEEKILSNLKHLVFPYLEKLKKNKKTPDDITYLNIIESNLKEIVSPFAVRFSSRYVGLTPKEMLIANLIKDGKQDKDIAEILSISLDTVKVHRKNIRKKLHISGSRKNLRVHLLYHK